MIDYIYNANAILSEPIKNRSTGELLHVLYNVYAKLHAISFKPQLHKLDNESSTALEAFITDNNTALQYMPPKIHQTNAVKQAVQTWKCNFKAGLPAFPNNFLSHTGAN